MTFREIDEKIYSLIDRETGEILDFDSFNNLQMEYSHKIESMALWILDLNDEVKSIEGEVKRLQKKKKVAEDKAKSLKEYMKYVTSGHSVKTPLVSVAFRPTEAVEIDDVNAVIKWAQDTGRDYEVLSYGKPTVSKTALKKIIESGIDVPEAHIAKNLSVIIK